MSNKLRREPSSRLKNLQTAPNMIHKKSNSYRDLLNPTLKLRVKLAQRNDSETSNVKTSPTGRDLKGQLRSAPLKQQQRRHRKNTSLSNDDQQELIESVLEGIRKEHDEVGNLNSVVGILVMKQRERKGSGSTQEEGEESNEESQNCSTS